MKLNLLSAAPALVAALWLGGAAVSASAQTIDAGTEAAADAAADAGSAATDTQQETSAAGAADASAPASSATGATTGATDAADQSSSQPSTSADAASSAGAQAQAPTPPAPAQPDASAGISADAGASTAAGAAAQPENQQPAPSPDAAATADAGVDASIQGDTNVRADAQLGAQQNQQNLRLQQGLQFGQATNQGLAINTIAHDHFFFQSGLRPGDVLVSFAGRPIRSQADFNRWVFFQPGQRVPVVVLRNGQPQTIYIVHQQRPGVEYQAGYAPASGGAYLGVTFDAQTPQQAIVRTVSPGSPAERAGIRPGDVIFAVNGNQVGGSQDVIRVVSSMQPGQPIDVAISRQVVLGSRPGVAQAAYSPDVRIQGGIAPQPAPAVPVAPAPAVVDSAAVDADAVVVPGSGRFDNTPARAGDVDRDGRLLDADGRVGPVEGRAILPRRRN
jgi:membrane-associated protease RseP (regulator of RpoE activity)